MKNNDIDKKKIALITGIAFAAVIVLSLLVSHSLSKHPSNNDSGLRKPAALTEEESRPVPQTEQDRSEEYENREEMPAVTEEVFYDTISKFLASGNFDALDNTLRHWQETYKDSADESESKSMVIDKYRGDIAYYKSIVNSDTEALSSWHFMMPDTLAASIAYTPIMKKYAAFISQDSLILPAVSEGENINLRKSDKTNEELSEIRDAVNRTRRDETAFQQIAVYDMTLYGYPCQFIAVMDKDTVSWIPHSIQVTNNMIDLPTASFGKNILRNNPDADLDKMIAVPAAISEKPEGVEGNIDREQEGIPNSQMMPMDGLSDMIITPPADNEAGAVDAPTAETETAPLPSGSVASEPETASESEQENEFIDTKNEN